MDNKNKENGNNLGDLFGMLKGVGSKEELEEVQKQLEEMGMGQLSPESTEMNDDVKPIQVSFYKESDELPDPDYSHESDSGFDLRSNDEEFTLKPLERKMVSTGLYFALPKGVELQIRPRSGLAAKQGITVLNTPGTVDSSYRGEIKVILVNLSNEETATINYADRIAQAVINIANTGEFVELNGISKEEFNKENTDRGDQGFGSTGKK